MDGLDRVLFSVDSEWTVPPPHRWIHETDVSLSVWTSVDLIATSQLLLEPVYVGERRSLLGAGRLH